MATKPSLKPEFASDDVTLPVAQTDNKVRPTEPLRLNGYDLSQKPTAQNLNWMFNNIKVWLDYFEEVTDDIGVTEVASKAEAEAGTDNSKIMTSLRTREATKYYMNLYGLDGKVAELPALVNLKTVTDNGFYIASSASDKPLGTSVGFLEVMTYDDGSTVRTYQTFRSITDEEGGGLRSTNFGDMTFTRHQLWSGGAWSNWRQVWSDANAKQGVGFANDRGYQELPSGIILQWGRYGSSIPALTTRSFDFPVEYPNATHSVVLTALDSGDQAKAQVTSYNNTGASIRAGNDNLSDVFFFAVGR